MADSLSDSLSESVSYIPEDPLCGPQRTVAVRDYGEIAGSARTYMERTSRLQHTPLPAAMLTPSQLRIHSTPLETINPFAALADAGSDGLTEEWPPAAAPEEEDE
jgi:hypothetical protein